MKFQGKMGVIIPTGISVCLFFTLLLTLTQGGVYVLGLPLIIAIFLAIWSFPNYLILNEEYIDIKIGINKKRIYCHEILSLEKTNDPTQSFALSLDRVRITCFSGESIMVSLNDNDKFIEILIKNHPHIFMG